MKLSVSIGNIGHDGIDLSVKASSSARLQGLGHALADYRAWISLPGVGLSVNAEDVREDLGWIRQVLQRAAGNLVQHAFFFPVLALNACATATGSSVRYKVEINDLTEEAAIILHCCQVVGQQILPRGSEVLKRYSQLHLAGRGLLGDHQCGRQWKHQCYSHGKHR